MPRRSALVLPAVLLLALAASAAGADSAVLERGRAAYAAHCMSCHQPEGQGVGNVFPPLAGSDYLMQDTERSIRIALQGMGGEITVNGVRFNGTMPPPVGLDDQSVADVLTFIRNSWGNQGDAVTPTQVSEVRARLAEADRNNRDPYAPLPAPPAGFRIREVVKLPAHAVRLAAMPGKNWMLVLGSTGDLFRVEPDTGNMVRILANRDYVAQAPGLIEARGLTIDSRQRVYVVVNRRTPAQPFVLNRVTIYRSTPLAADGMAVTGLEPWLQTSYPWGNSFYNHGVAHIAEGPDGMLYVGSGSRTDGGEPGTAPTISKEGETEITAALWRLDPRAETPQIEVFARGIRNPWTFAWNDRGELFSATNGPDAEMPEELDFVQEGKHYGFPYQYADTAEKPYSHTPALPPGVTPVHAIRNFGPAGGGAAGKPMASFDPHSSPTGLIFCGPEWPEAWRGRFLMGRFGAMTGSREAGFDILSLALQRNAAGAYEMRAETFLAPVARPIDLRQVGRKLYVLEYTRPVTYLGNRPQSPGRILELSW